MGSVNNLFSATPLAYLAPFGESPIEVDDLTPPTVTVTPAGNWTVTGFSLEDYNIDYEPTHEFHMVNEHTGKMKAVLVEESVKITLTLAEADMQAYSEAVNAATLAAVAAAGDQTQQATLTIGDGSVTQLALALVGLSPAAAGSRVFEAWKVVQTNAPTFNMKKGVWDGTQVEFEAMVDTTQAAGARLCKYWDILAVATS